VRPERDDVRERQVHRQRPRDREGGERRATRGERECGERDRHERDAGEHRAVERPGRARRRVVRAEGQREDEEAHERRHGGGGDEERVAGAGGGVRRRLVDRGGREVRQDVAAVERGRQHPDGGDRQRPGEGAPDGQAADQHVRERQHDGQADGGHLLRVHGQAPRDEGGDRAPRVPPQPEEDARRHEDHGEDLLPVLDRGDGLRMHRVYGEQQARGAGRPGTRAEPQGEDPDQPRRRGVQHDVAEMEAGHPVAPHEALGVDRQVRQAEAPHGQRGGRLGGARERHRVVVDEAVAQRAREYQRRHDRGREGHEQHRVSVTGNVVTGDRRSLVSLGALLLISGRERACVGGHHRSVPRAPAGRAL
jgi:hypothetical protein